MVILPLLPLEANKTTLWRPVLREHLLVGPSKQPALNRELASAGLRGVLGQAAIQQDTALFLIFHP